MSDRADLLAEASALVDGDRNSAYGPPSEDFGRTAQMWSAYLGVPIEAHQVAACQIMVKLSRLAVSPAKRDHWIDMAGYAACGWDCIVVDQQDDAMLRVLLADLGRPQS